MKSKLSVLALLLMALIVAPVTQAQRQRINDPEGVRPFQLIQSGTDAVTTTGIYFITSGKPHRVYVALTGTATVTVYGTDKPCGVCVAADGTSLGTITTDGGTLDVNTGTRYLYVFALVTSYTSGTIRADVSPLQDYFGGTLGDAGSVNVANIMHFGGNPDGSTDNLAAANAALATLSDEGTLYFPKHATGSGVGYYFSDTLTVDHRINVHFEPGINLIWDVNALGDNPAFEWDGSAADNASYQPTFTGYPIISINNTNTSNTNNYAFDAVGVRHAFVEIGAIYNGYGGIRLHASSGAYVAFNRLEIGRLFGQVVGVQAYADGTGSVDAWINSNELRIGEYFANSGVETTAVDFRRVNSPTDDNLADNVIEFLTVEGGGGSTNTLATFAAGSRNTIKVKHLESHDEVIDVVATEGTVVHNIVELQQVFQSDTQSSITYVSPPATGAGNGLSDWYGNVVTTTRAEPKVTSWTIDNVATALWETDGSGVIALPGMSFQGFNTDDWSWESRADNSHEIIIPEGNISAAYYSFDFRIIPLVMIDTTVHKTFTFQWYAGDRSDLSAGRVVMFAQKADGTFYDEQDSNNLDRLVFEGRNGLSGAGWGGWGQGTDEGDQVKTVSVDDTIVAVLVGLYNGSRIRSIGVSVPYNNVQNEPLRIIDPFGTRDIRAVSAAPATIGYYGLGETFMNTSGTAMYIATTAGWFAPAWVTATAYTEGQLVLDDTNNIYAALSAGTSGATGVAGTSSTGTHDGSNNAATLTDSGETFTVDVWIGLVIQNTTDGSECAVTDNDATTVTCTLSGGTDNDWDTGDAWSINALDDGGIAWRYVDEQAAFTTRDISAL